MNVKLTYLCFIGIALVFIGFFAGVILGSKMTMFALVLTIISMVCLLVVLYFALREYTASLKLIDDGSESNRPKTTDDML